MCDDVVSTVVGPFYIAPSGNGRVQEVQRHLEQFKTLLDRVRTHGSSSSSTSSSPSSSSSTTTSSSTHRH
jgi:hypothetical protein